ncbi:MAG: radical SAM protein [Candidatus Hodarchaeota archaeon]
MIDDYLAFVKKTELLCKGLYLDKNRIQDYLGQGIEIDFGRKGGAGPSGGRYFLLDNGVLVNVALWDNRNRTDLVLGENRRGYFEIFNTNSNASFGRLKLVSNPEYYNPNYMTSDGIPMKKIALVHGLDCLASTIYQKCVYWACGEGCKFCGIELSLKSGDTILEKTPQQMIEVIKAAIAEGRCNHMTLTSGTDETDDKGANRYTKLLEEIKNHYPELPLHVQIEPLDDLNYIRKLKEAGADTIGIHIEVLDENIRKELTPGKYHIPYEDFEKNWEYALKIFGKNQVETFILTGFGENYENLINDLERIIHLGVIPFITPVRSILGKKDMPLTDHELLVKIYQKASNLLKEYGVNPLENKAGCVRCGGCSAIKEAYKIA